MNHSKGITQDNTKDPLLLTDIEKNETPNSNFLATPITYSLYVAYSVSRISIPLARIFVNEILKYNSDALIITLIPTSAFPAFCLSALSNYIISKTVLDNFDYEHLSRLKTYWFPLITTLISAIPSIKVSADFVKKEPEQTIVAIGLFFSALGINGRFSISYWKPKSNKTKNVDLIRKNLEHLFLHNPEKFLEMIWLENDISSEDLALQYENLSNSSELNTLEIKPSLRSRDYAFFFISSITSLNYMQTGFESTSLFRITSSNTLLYLMLGFLIGSSSALVNLAIHMKAFRVFEGFAISIMKSTAQADEMMYVYLMLLPVLYFSFGFALRSGGFAYAYPFPGEKLLKEFNANEKEAQSTHPTLGIIESIFMFVCSFCLSVMSIVQFSEYLLAACIKKYSPSTIDPITVLNNYEKTHFILKKACLLNSKYSLDTFLDNVEHRIKEQESNNSTAQSRQHTGFFLSFLNPRGQTHINGPQGNASSPEITNTSLHSL